MVVKFYGGPQDGEEREEAEPAEIILPAGSQLDDLNNFLASGAKPQGGFYQLNRARSAYLWRIGAKEMDIPTEYRLALSRDYSKWSITDLQAELRHWGDVFKEEEDTERKEFIVRVLEVIGGILHYKLSTTEGVNIKDRLISSGLADQGYGLGKTVTKYCSICHMPYSEYGNNARPVNDGRCCDRCNKEVVIPARIKRMQEGGGW